MNTKAAIEKILTKHITGYNNGKGDVYFTLEGAITQILQLVQEAEREARIDQTNHLHGAENKFGKVDWQAALYNLDNHPKYAALKKKAEEE